MPTYDLIPPDHEVYETLADLIGKYHPDLMEAKVTISAMFAYANRTDDGEKKGPALKLHGYACYAIVHINSLKDRVEGKADATIVMDGDEYPGWGVDQTQAILDHEITHLNVLRDDAGAFKTDDHGRPRLKMRLHDLVVGGFAVIAERHGDAAIEVQAIKAIQVAHEQLRWDWAETHERKGKSRPVAAPALAAGTA